jgi:hypothetical protein
MTKDEFYRLLRPFVAGVGDAHTNFTRGYVIDHARPGGVPLRFKVVEEFLVVVGIERPHQALLGSRLVSIEGLPLAELVARQRRLQGIDNQYHALHVLATRSLAHRAYMQDLIPEWKDGTHVRVELLKPDGGMAALDLAQPGKDPAEVRPPSRVVLPAPGESGFRRAFLAPPDGGQEVAYVRFTHMGGYRETREQRDPIITKIARPPSATDSFRELVVEMKQRQTQTLILDVRGNPGGNSLISEILVYYLYGREKLLEMAGVGSGEHGAFRAEYDAGTYSGYYRPKHVFVLCDAGTLSAGFSVVVEFWRLGATTVGTPPAQAPNSYGSGTIWKLRHTGLEGQVPMISAAHFPDDPSKAHVLPVDHRLTYERLATYSFDPNAEYLYALALRW